MTRKGAAARRLDGFGTSIFTEMTRLAVEHQAVNLGQGFPDFPAPEFVKQAARAAIADDHNQYAAAPGLPRLRRAIAEHFQRRHGLAVDPDREVTVAAGATECLFDAILALLDPGDEAIVFEPTYDAYVPAIRMAGGVARVVTLRPPLWDFDADELAQAFTTSTKLLVLNTPHNPTGKVFSPAELDVVARLCAQHDVIAVCDEVYSEITFDGVPHVPLASRAGMRERTVTVDSIGKTFSVTGWKIGWAIAAPALTAAIRGVHQFVTFCNATPFQEAAVTALDEGQASGYFDRLRAEYAGRRDRLHALLAEVGLPTLPIQGAYFLLAEFDQFGTLTGSRAPRDGLWQAKPASAHAMRLGPGRFADDVAFCRHLTTDVGVAAIPPSVFYADPASAPRLVRFCFAKSDATLAAAAERLRRLSPG